MKHVLVLLLLGCLYTSSSWAQCAPGIPEAGNPDCIPPDQKDSPYYQGNAPAHPSAAYADRWGAVAIDSDTGQAGTSVGKQSKSEAVDTAMADCKVHGSPNCRLRIAYYDQCVAVAWGKGFNSVSSAGTIEVAAADSMKSCSARVDECKVVYKDCSLPERVK
jgi:Domain of unknown function (DUF4189)